MANPVQKENVLEKSIPTVSVDMAKTTKKAPMRPEQTTEELINHATIKQLMDKIEKNMEDGRSNVISFGGQSLTIERSKEQTKYMLNGTEISKDAAQKAIISNDDSRNAYMQMLEIARVERERRERIDKMRFAKLVEAQHSKTQLQYAEMEANAKEYGSGTKDLYDDIQGAIANISDLITDTEPDR